MYNHIQQSKKKELTAWLIYNKNFITLPLVKAPRGPIYISGEWMLLLNQPFPSEKIKIMTIVH